MYSKIASIIIGSVLIAGIARSAHALDGRKLPVVLADQVKGDPVEIDRLPKAVVDAVQKELPGAHLTKAVKRADGNYFLTDVKVGKKEYALTISPDGKILKREEDND
jgi:hypothetical protein